MRPALPIVVLASLGLMRSAPGQPTPTPGPDLLQVCATAQASLDELGRCATHYFDTYSKAPEAPGGDEHLYNAGTLFERAGSIGAAINAYSLLRKFYPRSKLDPKALARVAKLYAQLVMYDKAAEALEEYAKRYAGQQDAYYALSDAVWYRKALGDDAKAIENTKYFIKAFGAQRPADAANADFSLTALYEKRRDNDAVRKHLQSYIRTWGAKGGDGKLVIAYAKLGQLLWDESCPVKPIDGSCVRAKRMTKPAVCSQALTTVEVVKRNDNKVKDALAASDKAAKLFEAAGGNLGDDGLAARYYYARAKLLRVDADAEARLYAAAPPGKSKLADWLEDEVALRGKYAAKYEAILAIKDAATSIAAASRLARLVDTLASTIADAASSKAECDALSEQAAPMREQAVVGYAVCLSKAAELAWFDDDARTCERALFRLAPDRFPPLREVTGDALNTATVTAVSGP